MNGLTTCNYCLLERIKARAKREGDIVTIMRTHGHLPGKNVYVHPEDVHIQSLPGGREGERKKYLVAWMMAIGKRCDC